MVAEKQLHLGVIMSADQLLLKMTAVFVMVMAHHVQQKQLILLTA